MKNVMFAVIVLLALWLFLPRFGINASFVIANAIEWSTKFILPWVALYWGIRLVKALEKVNEFPSNRHHSE
ncbi:hypothetical protein [Oceanobacillus senegalensis]|uniref:hypothetical protein n=1 Tax=Oceanobacillus senegalensis TaxID=1936063 RepID=UPI001FE96062|nr:hypothetical protein [Oceanobacillus senegalensis]